MRSLLRAFALLVAVACSLVLAHCAVIELGREVVTVRIPQPDGTTYSRRLWIVDEGASGWLHSGGADWHAAVRGDPIVELERGGSTRRYRATAVPGSHPEVDRLLREKYGVADRWVRTIGPDNESVLAVRLDPI